MTEKIAKRKNVRLQGYDYASSGAYFLTVCVHGRKNILSTIVGEEPFTILSSYGKIVEKWIKKLPEKYQNIAVDCYVIMPNHLHLLLSKIKEDGQDDSATVKATIGWLKYQATKEINKTRDAVGEKVFQRSFYDHIVRNSEDYQEIYNYINQNPLNWKLDKMYAEDEKE